MEQLDEEYCNEYYSLAKRAYPRSGGLIVGVKFVLSAKSDVLVPNRATSRASNLSCAQIILGELRLRGASCYLRSH